MKEVCRFQQNAQVMTIEKLEYLEKQERLLPLRLLLLRQLNA